MTWSVYDAVRTCPDTYLRAWRAYDDFEGSSLRTWLYRIATNVCLTNLESKARRPLPTGSDALFSARDLVQATEVPWLEPVPT